MSTPDGILATGPYFPTVLVAVCAQGLRNPLSFELQSQGYLVLQAGNGVEALEIVKTHSRPIHLMLTDGGPEGRALASTVKQYRRRINVVFIAGHPNTEDGDLFSPDDALIRVQELVSPPGKAAKIERAATARSMF